MSADPDHVVALLAAHGLRPAAGELAGLVAAHAAMRSAADLLHAVPLTRDDPPATVFSAVAQ